MALYVVEISVRTVVQADDDLHAQAVAEDQFRDIARDERPEVSVEHEVFSARCLPSGWDLDCLPYGGDGNTRLRELVASQTTNGGSNGEG